MLILNRFNDIITLQTVSDYNYKEAFKMEAVKSILEQVLAFISDFDFNAFLESIRDLFINLL